MVVSTIAPIGIAFPNVAYADESISPISSKTKRDNGDGTHTISLSVKGTANTETTKTDVNVLVVFDTSGSMNDSTGTNVYVESNDGNYGLVNGEYVELYRYRGVYYYYDYDSYTSVVYTGTRYTQTAQSRLDVAKSALNSLAQSMLSNNDSSNPDAVEMAFIDFSTHTNSTSEKTTSLDTFKSWVNNTSANGGTNWEEALNSAKNYSFGDDNNTYVIFISDGNPTFRVSKNGYDDWNSTYQAYGTGRSDPNNRNFNAAKTVADSIIASGKPFYSVGVFGDATAMQNLGGTYKDARDQAALNAAFNDIVNAITNSLTLEGVKFTDGITDMTSIAAVDGEVSNFKYFIKEKGGEEHEWADAPHARYEDGNVVWEIGNLADGTEARVEFVVWPSQESYDLVAKLNNGEATYDESTMPDIVKNNDGTYALRTNKSGDDAPKLIYTVVTQKTNAAGEVIGVTRTPGSTTLTNPDPVGLTDYEMTISKHWNDSLDPSQRLDEKNPITSVKLDLYRDNEKIRNDLILSADSSDPTNPIWKLAENIHIAPGVMISKNGATAKAINANGEYNDKVLGDYIVLESGHEYWFEEEDIDYHFELTKYSYHPMLVDGVLKNVIFTKDADGNITGIKSIEDDFVSNGLYAENTLKGGINITKKIVDNNGAEITNIEDIEDEFTFDVDLLDAEGNAYDYDYRIFYGVNNPNYVEGGDNRSGHICSDAKVNKSCDANSITGTPGHFSQTIYAGDTIRVINVDNGTLYSVSESQSDIPFGYSYVSTEYQKSDAADNNTTTVDQKQYHTVSGNTASTVVITNKYTSGNLKLSKTVNGNPSVAKEFDFKVVFKDNKGAELTGTYNYTLGNKKGTITSGDTIKLSAGQEVEFLNLPAGATYEITETSLPGYTTTVNGTAGNVARGTISNTTEATAAFVNTYNLEKVSTSFVADKQFNDWTADDKFVFELRDKDGNYITEATVDQDHKSATFNVEYSAPGEYTYTISEKALEDNARNQHINTTTAPNTLTVTVKVYDDGKGHLVIDGEPTFTGNQSTIINTYESTGSITIGAGKILAGRDWADGDAFTFDLYDLNGDTEKKIGTITLENGEIVNFDTAISYTTEDRDKTFYYVIREDESKSGHSAGLTNQNPNGVAITVTLSDDHQGNLTATINGVEGNSFTGTIENKYETKPTTATFDVQKTIEDLTNSKRDGEFEFQLIDKNGSVLQTKKITTNNLTGSVAFNAISYDKAGTYTYTIKEVKGSTKGFTYDETVHTVVVTVVDNIDTAQLSATVTVDGKNTSTASFNNTYAAKSVTEELFGVSKKVTGLAAGAPTKNFVFDLTGDATDSVTINGEGSESFKPLTYTAVGEYHYTISERNTGESGYTYDTTVYTATVNVDDVNGELKPTVTIKKGGSVVDKIEFTNTYAATGSAKISVKKEFAGAARDWSKDSFTFTLEETDSVLGEATASANTNWMATFDDIEYTEAGTYTYMIKESESNLAGVSASRPVKVNVIVTDNGDGTLKAEVQDPSSYVITNTYETKATSATLHVEKEIEDQSNSDVDGTFTFILKDSEGKEIETKDVTTTDGEGGVDFSTISYDKAGEYRYTITEKADNQAGFIYDTKEYEVVVNVTDDPSKAQLSAEVKINGVVTNEAKFTNIYKATPVDVQLHVNKEIEDLSNSKVDGTFEFKLSDSDNEEVEIIRVSTKDLVGGADFSKINFTETGTYNYTIEEVKGTTAGFSYDTTKHNVVITVSDKESKLVAEVKIDGEETKSVTITNEYKAEPVTIIPGAYKVLNGMNEGVEPVDFSFTLSGDNIDDETVTRNGEGSVEFSPITLDKVGTYEFTVKEINDGAPGYTYDGSIFSIIVEVTDAAGKLEAKISYKKNGERADGVIFENTYSTEEITIVPEATKILLGRDQEKGEFTFKVFLDGELVATGYNDENGNVIFDNEISFSEVGTYKLVIKEIAGNDPEIEYDTTEYEYTLNVSDTGLGTLMIEYEGGAEDAIFVNKFIGGKGEEIPSNPRTYDDIATSIAILSTSIIGLIAAVIFGKRKAKED